MGWWSETITGGDTPYDILGELGDIAGYDYFDESPSQRKRKELIGKCLPKLLTRVKKFENHEYGDDYNVAGQVLAVFIMEAGGPMTETIRKHILTCARADNWMKNGDDENERRSRSAYIAELIKKVEKYPTKGRVTYLSSEGLLQKLEQQLSKRTDK